MVDIPNTTSTTAEVTVGGTYTGGPGGDATIETVGDHDWIRVVLAPGQAVQINLTGGTLPDPYLRLRDSNGNLVAENDDINYPANVDSQLVYYSESGGTYYIDAAGYEPGSNTGTYTISVVDIPLSGLDLGDVLDTGSTVPDNDITVYFAPAGWSQSEGGGVNIVSEGFTAYEIQQFQLAFDLIEFYTGITFTVVNDPNADFRLVLDTNQLDPYNDALAYFYFPGGGALSGLGVFSGVPWRAVDSIFDGDTDPDGDPNVLLRGGDGFATIVHELLHGLGLAHPHDSAGGSDVLLGVTGPFGSYGVSNLNQMIYTIMSYNRGWVNGAPGSTATDTYGGAGGPMAIDIAVLQQYYGAPAANTGNDIYTLPDSNGIGTYWTAIWDTAGTDEIRYDGTRDTTIDLRAATLNYQPGGGGFVSSASGIAGGFTIAQNVVIENATGGSGVDTIVGNDANNVIEGRAGGDNLDGGAGTGDTVSYASSNTGVTVNLATNAVSGGHAAGDTIANFENVIGSGFVDVLTGSSGANSLSGLAGNDTLDGGAGADALDGGADIDTVTYASSNAGVTVNLGAGTGLGGHAAGDTLANIENAIGSGFADNLIGSTGVNNLNGGGGDDTIEGGAGGDTLDGGAGTGDTVSYAGSDAGVTVNLATNSASGGHAAGDAISNFENILGSGLVDNLIGSTGDNVIEGGAGGDTMNGGLGNDTLSYASSNAGVTVNLATNTASGGHATGDTFSNFENALGSAHADTIDGSTGANVLSGGGSSDILRGGDGNDTLNGDAGNDFLYGQNDNDTLNGGEGNDTLNGQTGADTMTGGNGNDTYFIDNAGDVVNEAIGTGVDTTDTVITSVNFRQDLMTSARGVEYIVVTGTGNVTIVAMETFNVITGNSGNNYIAGYGGNDTIDAGAGTDFVFGGDGRDLLTGGLGNDTFYYSFVADSGGTINRRDTITDFGQTAGNDDVIDLRPLDAVSFNSGVQQFTWLDTGAFTGAHGELRYFYDAVNNLTIIEGNTFGDTAPEFQLALVGNYTLTAGAAGLGHDILIV